MIIVASDTQTVERQPDACMNGHKSVFWCALISQQHCRRLPITQHPVQTGRVGWSDVSFSARAMQCTVLDAEVNTNEVMVSML